MATVRAYSEHEILMGLCARLLRDIEANASLGYPDASLPALEAFERPGWTVLWAPPGAYQVAIPTLPDPIADLCDGGDAYRPIEPQIEVVRARVVADIDPGQYEGGKRWLGLGFSVPHRKWVIFHG